MKKNFALLFISIFLIAAVAYFAGCGDDSSSTITLPQGATGATGNTGITGNTGPEAGTASLMVNVWQDDAHTQPFTESFTVRLQRIYTNPGTSDVTTYDTSGEGTVTITDVTPGNYRVYVQALGYPEENQDVEVTIETTTKAVANLDFVMAPQDRVFYVVSPPSGYYPSYVLSYSYSSTYLSKSRNGFGNSSFYTVSSSTGEATTVNSNMGVMIFGMDFSSDNILYAVGIEDFVTRQDYNYWGLYKIDPFTGNTTPLMPLTGDAATDLNEDNAAITDVSAGPDGTLYGFYRNTYTGEDTIVEINKTTGELTLLNQPAGYPSFCEYSTSIAFPGSDLYFLMGLGYNDPSVLYLWNNPTGTSSLTVRNSDVGYNFFSGMDGYEGNLYTVAYNYSNTPGILISINPSNGTPTAVGNVKDELDNTIYYINDLATP